MADNGNGKERDPSSDMVTVCSYVDLSPFSTNTPSQSEIFYIYIYIDEQSTITENISLWEGVLVLKGQYLRTTYNNREYFCKI